MKTSKHYILQNKFLENEHGDSISNFTCWNHEGQMLFAIGYEKYNRRWTHIKNWNLENIYMLPSHAVLDVWDNQLVAIGRIWDDVHHLHSYTCLCSIEGSSSNMTDINMHRTMDWNKFSPSDHSDLNHPLRCQWSRKYGEIACIWEDNLCVYRTTEDLKYSIAITSPTGKLLGDLECSSNNYQRVTAMGVIGQHLWCILGVDAIQVWERSSSGQYFLKMRIGMTHSVMIVSICEFNEWSICGTAGGYILLYNKLNGTQPKKNWGLSVGTDRVSLSSWRGRLITASGNTISIFNAKMELEDTIIEPSAKSFVQMKVLESGMICAAARNGFFMFKGNSDVEVLKYEANLEWRVHRLLWIAFLKNQANEECHLARLPKELIKFVAQELKI